MSRKTRGRITEFPEHSEDDRALKRRQAHLGDQAATEVHFPRRRKVDLSFSVNPSRGTLVMRFAQPIDLIEIPMEDAERLARQLLAVTSAHRVWRVSKEIKS